MTAYVLWSIIFYVIVALLVACTWRILSKAGQPGWLSLIPFVGIIRLLEITGRSGWWILAWLVPLLSWFVLVRMAFDRREFSVTESGMASASFSCGPSFFRCCHGASHNMPAAGATPRNSDMLLSPLLLDGVNRAAESDQTARQLQRREEQPVKYGLDCVSPPSAAQGQAMLDLGWSWLNAYVGGPYLTGHTPWSNASVAALADVGFVFLPLYVGQQNVPGHHDLQGTLTFEQGELDGAEAIALNGACGFGGSTLLGLDLESGNYEHDPQGAEEYVRGWVEVVNGAGHKALLYCNKLTAHNLGVPSLVDLTWVADPIVDGANYQQAPQGHFDPSADPPWDAWQFGFNGNIAGVSVDVNSARDDFPFASESQ
jgi:Domain of unknown function (DUF1906)/Family of unknown function (DUF5684)